MSGYQTALGRCIQGDSLKTIEGLDGESIDLVMTSPPFSLQRHKSYGEVEQKEYVEWLLKFGEALYPKLKPTGSIVIDIGGAYKKGTPVKSLYPFRFLIGMCDYLGYNLAQDFYWHNTSALPSPIEWVNKRKIRCKTSVNTVWWFSKTDFPKANINNVRVPYSSRMKKLMDNPQSFVKEEGVKRPSGHVMGMKSWTHDNGGAIPSNLLQISNSESNGKYLRYCKDLGITRHPARFPYKLPEFFIKFLTDENDIVLDIFSGSNTTGYVAEELNRRWLSVDIDADYVASSIFRFLGDEKDAMQKYNAILKGDMVTV